MGTSRSIQDVARLTGLSAHTLRCQRRFKSDGGSALHRRRQQSGTGIVEGQQLPDHFDVPLGQHSRRGVVCSRFAVPKARSPGAKLPPLCRSTLVPAKYEAGDSSAREAQ